MWLKWYVLYYVTFTTIKKTLLWEVILNDFTFSSCIEMIIRLSFCFSVISRKEVVERHREGKVCIIRTGRAPQN